MRGAGLGTPKAYWQLERLATLFVRVRETRCSAGRAAAPRCVGDGRAWRYRRPAAGSVVGLLGQTGRLGLAS